MTSADQSDAVLDRFSPATRAWFDASFPAPTPAQGGPRATISSGSHSLVTAPTGSGKTLAAFLWAIDRIVAEPRDPSDDRPRCRIIYISPLKALAVDVERNLRSPLIGIGHAASRLGLASPQVSVAVRSGDTPAQQRREFARDGAEMTRHLTALRDDPDLRASLAAAGLETIRARHTCAHRVDELLAVVASLGAPKIERNVA